MFSIATECLICGDPVRMEHNKDFPKICNMCKEAILTFRKACFPENCPPKIRCSHCKVNWRDNIDN